MENSKKLLANRIFILRNSQGLTQQEFVLKLKMDITTAQVSRIENGINTPSADFIRAVCLAFNVTPEWLLGINDCKLKDPSIALSSEEIELAFKFRNLSEDNKFMFTTMIDIVNARNNK